MSRGHYRHDPAISFDCKRATFRSIRPHCHPSSRVGPSRSGMFLRFLLAGWVGIR